MVKTPYIFSQIQRKPFSANTTFGDQMPQNPTRPLMRVPLASENSLLLPSIRRYAHPLAAISVYPPRGIRVNNRTALCPLVDQGQDSCRLYTSNYLSPYIAMTAQDTKHRLFACPATSLSPLQSNTFCLFFPRPRR
jgi:hypothetical protein